MTDASEQSNLPTQIANALTGIPKALIPTSVKAIDRLVGAAVDIPVAWLTQKKAQIDAQTQAYTLVEKAIADAAANLAGGDTETVQTAMNVLVRKAYKKQINRQSVVTAMIEDLRSSDINENGMSNTEEDENRSVDLDEDWLNVFERYAEDASTERMQNLWGRVLSGEVRKPGRYSMRTLRFLSEFSQNDGLTFADFCKSAFGDIAPSSLVKPKGQSDIRDLIYMESCGLIQGALGLGLNVTTTFDSSGNGFFREGSLLIMIQGNPGESVKIDVCILTPLGQELLSLIPGRDARVAARNVANAIKSPEIKSAFLATFSENGERAIPLEILWQSQPEQAIAPLP